MFKAKSPASYLSLLLLCIIPIILLVSSLNIIEKRDKNWYGGGYDPSYAYLYNSLNIARFRLPGHFDHPGTPMQMTGAVILQTAWMINPYGGENLTEAVIREPEHYLKILNTSSAVIGALGILAAGWLVLLMSNNVWYGFIMQVTPFVSGIILYKSLLRISQENVLLIAAIAIAVYTLYWYFKHKLKEPDYFAKGFGIIAGFGMASKIIFFPLIAIPLLLLESKNHKLKFLKVAAISFVAFTIPIILLYPNMAWWFLRLFIYSGIYGSGDITILDASSYLVSLKELITGEPVYFAVYILTFISLVVLLIKMVRDGRQAVSMGIVQKINRDIYLNRPALLIILAVFLAQTAGYIITAKHPKPDYLLPYICMSGLVVIILLDLLTNRLKPILKQLITGAIVIPLVVLSVVYGLQSREQYYSTDKNIKYEQAWQTALNEAAGGAVIAVNPGPTPVAAAFFANAYSRDRYAELLTDIYPDYYIYDTYSQSLVNWSKQTISLHDLMIKYNNKVVIIGDAVDPVVESLTTGNNIEFNKVYTEEAVVAVAGIKE
jgi:hypothetical protein